MNTQSFSISPLSAAIASVLVLSFGVSANTVDSGTTNSNQSEIETISVLGQTYRNTATKTSLEPEETPQAITVIDSEELEIRGVKSLNQALRYAPGVVTENKGGSVTMYDTFSVRGFAVKQSYYDGLALQFLNGWNLQPQIDPIAIQQVEVFKGPTSVLYGSMPPGGMVNMIAKTPQKESNTDVGLATGSRNLMEASIDTTGQIGDSDFSYRIIGLARTRDGQVNHTEEERYVFAPSLNWEVSDKTLINFNLYYQNDPAMGMNSAMPASGSMIDNPNGSTTPNTFVGDKNWSKFEREVLMLGYKVDHQFNSNWGFLQNFRYTDASLYQENTYHSDYYGHWDPSTGNLDRNIYSTDEESKGYTVDNQLSGFVMTGDVEHNLLFGLDYQQLKGSSIYAEYGSTSQFGVFNIFNPNNDLINRDSLTKAFEVKDDVTLRQTGLYVQDQMRFDRLVVIAGGRYDNYKTTSDYAGSYTEADDSAFSYRVGALYEFENGLAPFANYATSFEPVTGVSSFGEAYKPETGQQIEVGLKYQSSDYSKTASASLFRIEKNDVLVTDPTSADFQDQLQVGQVRSQGLEVEAGLQITSGLDVAANYTYTDMEITKDSANGLQGTTPIYVPEHAANLWSNYHWYEGALSGTRLSGGVRYTGEMQMDATNKQGKVPSYTLVDLSIGYDLGSAKESLSGATVNLLATNLFNEEYFSCFDQTNCWYGEERTVELNVNYNF
ncbi:TonB-dependent siderophore receptor [Vibrio sp. 10N.261.55.A7]|uniref:TonB-dependent siderophore receptor n=1 Tax=Vibrio sp. 10N.261.55.A7 TaxID=1880851 RepID=UPI000C8438E2|nr:TonB-dependent siderophore receptor [Vibrio sp. 10N.261.55.A7]PMJ88733.1 ligand-gated channel protein [Vibrio sp. 10N.261.55.A7]